jgi:phosphopantothenoylcysteine decarboxylase/phosphopantothenate--cysteine ligase
VLEPGTGQLGSPGEWGIGRLPEPYALLAAAESAVVAAGPDPAWMGVRVLVTAGGTREPIDAVRFIGNRSSGRMGYALAEAAVRRGAEVTIVSANVALPPVAGARTMPVETAAELGEACREAFGTCDVLLMVAAVADYRPADVREGKIKKTQEGEDLELALTRTEDVLSGLAALRRPGQVLVGFAAETGAGALEYGRDKLRRKNLDVVVVNDVSMPGIGFDARENEVTILAADGERHVPRAPKAEIAGAILDAAMSRRSSTTLKV